MTMAATRADTCRPNRADDGSKALGGWPQLVATPIFAAMALANALVSPTDWLCSAAHGAGSLGGMTLMYCLMSIFHAGPWWKLLVTSRRGSRAAEPSPAPRCGHLPLWLTRNGHAAINSSTFTQPDSRRSKCS